MVFYFSIDIKIRNSKLDNGKTTFPDCLKSFTSSLQDHQIEKSVKDEIINNVGIMVNMETSSHGVNLLKDQEICFGQHTNICIGKPIPDPTLIPSITNENGEFKSSKEYRDAKEDFVVLEEVILEIEAQYKRYKELMGKDSQYFEGHAIQSDNFFKGLAIVANKYGLKYFGFSIGEKPVYINGKNIYAYGCYYA